MAESLEGQRRVPQIERDLETAREQVRELSRASSSTHEGERDAAIDRVQKLRKELATYVAVWLKEPTKH